MKSLKFIIVENNIVFRNAFKAILEKEFSAEVIATMNSIEDLSIQKNLVEADIIFIKLAIVGKDDLDLIRRILWEYPFLKVVGITSHTEHIYLLKLLEVGFKGCLDINNIGNEIYESVSNVVNGRIFFTEKVLKKPCSNTDELNVKQ